MTPTLLCLDFDGVICDSLNECMLIAFNAYRGSSYVDVTELPVGYQNMFRQFRYLVRDAGEYYLLLDGFYKNANINVAWFAASLEHTSSLRDAFRENFFAARNTLRSHNLTAWLRLHPPYQEVIDFMQHVAVPIDIVTTKDEESVRILLDAYRVSDKVATVYGQKALALYGGKAGAINRSCFLHAVLPQTASYVDDHLQHLEDVRVTGVNLWHATWGYVDPLSAVPADVQPLTLDRVGAVMEGR